MMKINIIETHIQDMQRSFYDNIDPRRRVEYEDSQMIQENHRAVANLPDKGYQIEFDHEYKPRYLRQ